jgi:hypothetical protein
MIHDSVGIGAMNNEHTKNLYPIAQSTLKNDFVFCFHITRRNDSSAMLDIAPRIARRYSLELLDGC